MNDKMNWEQEEGKGVQEGLAPSNGYLLVDTKKCQGCMTCMLACSLVHEGKENPLLSRIQVVQNSFSKFPDDIQLSQCRQCLSPDCVAACPTGALRVDTENGNVRRVFKEECDGCGLCLEACPHGGGRMLWHFEEEQALKCDLCLNTPYWNEPGGPGGKQACVSVCPVGAIKFTNEMPVQAGDGGYDINLRGKCWEKIGYTIN